MLKVSIDNVLYKFITGKTVPSGTSGILTYYHEKHMKTLKTLHYCPYKIFFMKTAVGEAALLFEI